jgi:hypothetical protein
VSHERPAPQVLQHPSPTPTTSLRVVALSSHPRHARPPEVRAQPPHNHERPTSPDLISKRDTARPSPGQVALMLTHATDTPAFGQCQCVSRVSPFRKKRVPVSINVASGSDRAIAGAHTQPTSCEPGSPPCNPPRRSPSSLLRCSLTATSTAPTPCSHPSSPPPLGREAHRPVAAQVPRRVPAGGPFTVLVEWSDTRFCLRDQAAAGNAGSWRV